MLLGTWELTISHEGRLALPPAFATATAAGVTVTRGFDRCLHAFPRSAWDALALRVGALPLGAEPARNMRRLLFGAAAHLALEEGGIHLPPALLEYAGIGSAVVVVGMDAYFELWSPGTWQAATDQLLATVSRWRGAELPSPLAAI